MHCGGCRTAMRAADLDRGTRVLTATSFHARFILISRSCHEGKGAFIRGSFQTCGDVERRVIVCSLRAMRRRLPMFCGPALATFSLAGMSLPSGSASAAQHSPASQLLSDSLNAIDQAGSMHFVDKTTVNGTSETLEGAISAP